MEEARQLAEGQRGDALHPHHALFGPQPRYEQKRPQVDGVRSSTRSRQRRRFFIRAVPSKQPCLASIARHSFLFSSSVLDKWPLLLVSRLWAYWCRRCEWRWQSRPTGECPGIKRYSAATATLKSRSQWKRLKRQPTGKPAGIVWTAHEWMRLYAESETAPIPPPSEAERQSYREARRPAAHLSGLREGHAARERPRRPWLLRYLCRQVDDAGRSAHRRCL